MKFPDAITVQRSAGPDTYGNPHGDWSAPASHAEIGFVLEGSARRKDMTVYMPATSDVLPGDRFLIDGIAYNVVGKPKMLRSPTKAVMLTVSIQRRPGTET